MVFMNAFALGVPCGSGERWAQRKRYKKILIFVRPLNNYHIVRELGMRNTVTAFILCFCTLLLLSMSGIGMADAAAASPDEP